MLAAGASFNKKRNGEAMRVFRGEPSSSSMRSTEPDDPPQLSTTGGDEEVNAFRNRLRIKVKGDNIPNPIATFVDMPIDKGIKVFFFTYI